MADINVTVTTPTTITATATDPNTVAVAVSAASTVTVSASVGNVGTVTSIATTAPITGGTITSTGTIGISAATTAAAGSMSASDKTKLDGIEAGAKTGDVAGPAGVTTDGNIAVYNGTTGKIIKDSSTLIQDLVTGAQVPQIVTDATYNAADVGTPNAGDKIAIVQDGEPFLLKSIQYSALNTHAPVTIADSTSIDMTLTGQQVSAAAIFGTSAGVVAEGNHTHHSYYVLQTSGVAAANPADNSTYYFGCENNATTGANIRNILFPFAGTIVYAAVVILVNTVLGDATQFSCYLRINNTTDILITSTASATASIQKFSNTALSTAVSVNDYFEGKIVYPTWPTTNPTGVKAYFEVGVRV